jgi:hypothetical protein
MSQSQLSIRSNKAKAMAHKFAEEDRRTITQVIEIALELYETQRPSANKESADQFWNRLVRENHVEGDGDIDLDAIIRASYKPHEPIEL